MSVNEEIQSYLNQIKSYLDDITILYDPKHVELGISSDYPYEARTSFNDFFSQYERYKKFLNKETNNTIKNHLISILSKLSTIEKKSFQNQNEHSEILTQCISQIKNLPDIFKEKFFNNSEITKEDIIILLEIISQRTAFLETLDIPNILENISGEYFEQAKVHLINLFNTLDTRNPNLDIIIRCYEFFKYLKDKQELIKLNENISDANQILIEVKNETGNKSNEKIGAAFYLEAKSLICKIRIYTTLIFSLFVLIIGSILKFIYSSKLKNIYTLPEDPHFYYFYASLILIFSFFITYIIKERARLVNHYQYCMISYLEIKSLSSYSAQISDKSKIDDLKIHLADRYFQGPNSAKNNSPSIQDSSLITSKLNELSNTIENIKKNLK